MNNIMDQIHSYDEKMLRMQYEVSEYITHQLTKGEIREDYIKKLIKDKIVDIKIEKGILVKADKQSSQQDIIIYKNNAIISKQGSHAIIEAEDCIKVFEIKSKLNNEYLNKLNAVAKEIKSMNNLVGIGMIVYKCDLQEKNVLKRFGYIYDKDIDTYEYIKEKVDEGIKNIDVIICFDEETEFMIIKDIEGYTLIKDKPIIKYFWSILKQ